MFDSVAALPAASFVRGALLLIPSLLLYLSTFAFGHDRLLP
jgi:hypothetical protein